MSYSKKDILTSISLMIFIITFAITFTVFFKPLFYSEITPLNLEIASGLSKEAIKENYDILINYQSIFYNGPLVFKDFTMSAGGRIHFEEVKAIFEFIQILLGISTISSIYLIYIQYKAKEFRYLKLTAIITVTIPVIIGLLAAIDFSKAFILFHKIMFNNDFWIFDYTTDPVITILPEVFFMHCFMMIVFIVIVLVLLCFIIYSIKRRNYLKAL